MSRDISLSRCMKPKLLPVRPRGRTTERHCTDYLSTNDELNETLPGKAESSNEPTSATIQSVPIASYKFISTSLLHQRIKFLMEAKVSLETSKQINLELSSNLSPPLQPKQVSKNDANHKTLRNMICKPLKEQHLRKSQIASKLLTNAYAVTRFLEKTPRKKSEASLLLNQSKLDPPTPSTRKNGSIQTKFHKFNFTSTEMELIEKNLTPTSHGSRHQSMNPRMLHRESEEKSPRILADRKVSKFVSHLPQTFHCPSGLCFTTANKSGKAKLSFIVNQGKMLEGSSISHVLPVSVCQK